jgi:hypothetical protein
MTLLALAPNSLAAFADRLLGAPQALAGLGGAASDPSGPDLLDKLNDFAKAPGATTVTHAPAGPGPASAQQQLLDDMLTLESYIAVLAAWVVYSRHPAPYDLSSPGDATQCVIDIANAKNYILTGGAIKAIPLYLPGLSNTVSTQSITTTSATIHTDLLKILFAGLTLSPTVLADLDGVLTAVTDTLKNLKLSFATQAQAFEHALSYYYFDTVEGSNPPLQAMKLRFVFMQIDQSSWKAAIGKSSVEHFSFSMTLYTSDSVMNAGMVSSNALTIAQSLLQLTAKDAASIQALIGAKTIASN